MATPQSMTSFDGGNPRKVHEQITFRFCSECSNMLYPKEDQDAHKLQYTCRTCQYTEEAQSSCIFRNELNNSAGETAGVTQDVGSDPTVGTTAMKILPIASPQDQSMRDEEPYNQDMPMLCLSCTCVITCATCGICTSTLQLRNLSEKLGTPVSKPEMGFCQFTLSLWQPDDPFDEYDEEREDSSHPARADVSGLTDDGEYSFSGSDDFARSLRGPMTPEYSGNAATHLGYDTVTEDGAMVFNL